MREMVEGTVLPDLVRRSGEVATIRSRFLRVWGVPESKVAQIVAPRLEVLDGSPARPSPSRQCHRGREGAGHDPGYRRFRRRRRRGPERALDAEEAELRALLGEAVAGWDAEGLEVVVGRLLVRAGLRLAVAESLDRGDGRGAPHHRARCQ